MDWQIGWVGKAVRILIQWWLLSWVQIPLAAPFFFKTLDVNFVQKCQICVENEKPDWDVTEFSFCLNRKAKCETRVHLPVYVPWIKLTLLINHNDFLQEFSFCFAIKVSRIITAGLRDPKIARSLFKSNWLLCRKCYSRKEERYKQYLLPWQRNPNVFTLHSLRSAKIILWS